MSEGSSPVFSAGDLVWLDFDPVHGRQQGGRHPALIVSPLLFWQATRFAIVCPITPKILPFSTSVVLPDGLPISGEVLTTHVRSIDTLARPIASAGARVPEGILAQVRGKLAALIGID